MSRKIISTPWKKNKTSHFSLTIVTEDPLTLFILDHLKLVFFFFYIFPSIGNPYFLFVPIGTIFCCRVGSSYTFFNQDTLITLVAIQV